MTIGGLPVVHVYLDDGTGSFPYDITAYLPDSGYSITRGRSDQLSTVQPGTLALTLDNTDGRFTLGSTIIASPSPIKIDQKVRVSVTVGATTSNRFTGYVQSWPVNWPDGLQTYSTCQVTAVDVSARWSRRTLTTIIGETILPDSPLVYYTMGEPSDAVAASDSSGKLGPQLVQTGTGTPVVFGTATGPGTDSLTAAQFSAVSKGLAGSLSTPPTIAAASIEFFVSGVSSTAPFVIMGTAPSAPSGLTISSDAVLTDSTGAANISLLGAISVADLGVHHVAVTSTTVGPTTTLRVYVDGALVTSGAGALAAGALSNPLILKSGPGPGGAALSHVAVYNSALSPARIAAHAGAGLTGFSGETSDLRIDRLIGYEGTVNSTAGDAGMVLVPNQDTTGRTVNDAVQQVVDAEVGLLWINGDGAARYANKDHVALATTPAMTIPLSSAIIVPGTEFSVDMQQVTNYVTGQREGDDGTQVVTNPTSITAHGTYPTSETWLVQSDVEVLSRAQWLITKYAEPSPRIPTLDLDMLIATTADQIGLLALDLTSHMKITGWPTQAPGGTTSDLVIEGYTEALTANSWILSPNCASWTQQSAGILNDATYGVLDTMTLGI